MTASDSQATHRVYRAPMRARAFEAAQGAGAEYGLRHGLVGIGDSLPSPPASVERAARAAADAYGAKAGAMVRRFAEVPDGAFVWTRERDGAYRLGRIAGPWRYERSAQASAVGIHHVRPAHWIDRPFGDDEVPAAVAGTFARGGRNFQRIHDSSAESRTAELWSRATAD